MNLSSFFRVFLAVSLCVQSIVGFAATGPIYFGIIPTNVKVGYKATNQAFDLVFYVVNNTTQKNTISDFQFTPSSSAGNMVKVAAITNDCGGVLGGQGSTCNIHVNITANGNKSTSSSHAPIRYRFSMKINASSGRGARINSPLTSDIVFATGKLVPSASRRIIFKNLCAASQKIYVGVHGGSVNSIKPAIPGKLTTCKTSADCYPGSTCLNTVPKQCFVINPVPKNAKHPTNVYFLGKGETNTIEIPTYDTGTNIIWSGGVAARVNCSGSSCKIADCGGVKNGKVGGCAASQGFKQPVTTAEFTLESESAITTATFNGSNYVESVNPVNDTYDTSIINGITVALSMQPVKPSKVSAYSCGATIAKKAKSPLGNCTWKFTPPSNSYIWVDYKKGAKSCNTSSNCSKPDVCGMSYNPNAAVGSRITKKCGIQLGLWTSDAICVADPQMNTAEFPCTTPIQGALTYADLFGCSAGDLAQSCYNVSTTTCCGCVDWNTVANVNVPYPPTAKCSGKNPIWQTHSQPRIEWLKRGCPTAYTYPYDDKASTFTCQKLNKSKINSTDYLVTFCPENA